MTEPAPGIKVLELIPKRPDISTERFHYYWGVLHPRVSRRVKPMERYVQHHRIADGLAGVETLDVDGITEAWFRSYESAQGGFNDPVFLNEGMPLMEQYIDLPHSSWLFLTEEVLIDTVDEGDPSARVILELRRAPGSSRQEFEAALRRHGKLAAWLPRTTRVAQFFRLPAAEADASEDNYDGAELLAFGDLQILEDVWGRDDVREPFLADLRGFCDLERSGILVAHSIKVK